jgi:exonuclease III
MSNTCLTISSLNCNSLNMSSKENQNLKIHGITSLKTDIIFISDIRLSNKNLVSSADDVSKSFLTNLNGSYDFFHHSSKNKRGVGILFKKDLIFSVVDRKTDEDENLLLLKVNIGTQQYILGSVYGPNEIDVNFFEKIRLALNDWGNENVILAGDWNCLFSCDNVPYNIDCMYMQACPNAANSVHLRELCDEFDLSDPYRFLYPDKKDFTYRPRVQSKKNRSRLDFFVISQNLLSTIDDCFAVPVLQNSLFDHKAVKLKIGKNLCGAGVKRFKIRNSALDIDLLQYRVEATVIETYLIHAIEGQIPVDRLNNMLMEIGLIKENCKDIPYPYEFWPNNLYDSADLVRRLLKTEQIRNRLNNLDHDQVCNLNVSCNDGLFIDVLLNNVKNEIISFQAHFFKWKKSTLENMTKQLASWKINYAENFDRINELEFQVNKIYDEDARRELEHFANFEFLNTEKMTPAFLSVAKSAKSSAKLSDIKKDDGTDFASEDELHKYIYDYYTDIYKVKPETQQDAAGCIENFLGPEIMRSKEIRDAKLTVEQCNLLERDIEITELDDAIKDMNSKTAGGPDGIGVPVYKKFWHLLRVPLHKGIHHMIQAEEMSDNFRVSAIRLIPKKGDISRIKNWRPISLLNVCYKICSKAINNRLKKIAPKILSRGQKGFVIGKYIQECLINITECINYCNRTSTQGFLLAIDQAKAFDTVSHPYIMEVYKFFGMGPRFISLLQLTTMGRHAIILFDNEKTSKPVKLGTGFTQGNGPSPLQFNFCQQILIFKIELDPRIKSIDWHIDNCAALRNQLPPPPDPEGALAQEEPGAVALQEPQQHPKGKVEGFADDTSVLAKAEREGLLAIKVILVDFAVISGLKVNFEKCILIPIGFRGPVPNFFEESGFRVDNKATILGMVIYNDINLFKNNYNMIIESLVSIRNFWARFNLSLPGRIAVAKTLMLSKVGYLGCFLEPDPEQIEEIHTIITSFVKGKLTVASSKICIPVANGGLGMIPVSEFITGLRCSWIPRARKNPNELWSYCIINLGISELVSFRTAGLNLPKEIFPVLAGFSTSFDDFTLNFLKVNNNILKSRFVHNPLIDNLNRGRIYLNNIFESERGGPGLEPVPAAAGVPVPAPVPAPLLYAQVEDVLTDGTVISKMLLEQKWNTEIKNETYQKIKRIITVLKGSKIITTSPSSKPKSIENLILGFKKGSKVFRSFLVKGSLGDKILNVNSIRKYITLIDAPVGKELVYKNFNSLWNFFAISNKMREFTYKFRNNILGINSRVHHFNRQVSEGCTFCQINNSLPVPRETFLHLFFDCPETQKTLLAFEGKYLSDIDLSSLALRKKFWFFGMVKENNHMTTKCFFQLVTITIMFYVWNCKLKKIVQSFASCKNFFFYHMDLSKKVSSSLRNEMEGIDIDLCRHWHGERPWRR